MNYFLFLYPVSPIIDFEIKMHNYSKRRYKKILNECIDNRYRQKGFKIIYIVFDDINVSDVIKLRPEDKILKAGISYKDNMEGKYPNWNFILQQLKDISTIRTIRLAGFHMWDCVERFAQYIHEKDLDVLVDEDLTESFIPRIQDPLFRIDQYPSYQLAKSEEFIFSLFMKARQNKPWLWQKY
ncbi:MAG: hypothetical protein PHY32_01210 [Candidatus Pacebacteria bacterium]|nr:hypothetical protein [Candidatus Paceibacterota bacterium]